MYIEIGFFFFSENFENFLVSSLVVDVVVCECFGENNVNNLFFEK